MTAAWVVESVQPLASLDCLPERRICPHVVRDNPSLRYTGAMQDHRDASAVPTPGLASESTADEHPTEVCAWCGTPITEDDAFILRVCARLCPACAEEAGRIAAEQAGAQVQGLAIGD